MWIFLKKGAKFKVLTIFLKIIKTFYKIHIQKHSRHLLINTKIKLSTSKHKRVLLECDLVYSTLTYACKYK